MTQPPSPAPADLVVLSDLHLGEGLVCPPHRYSPMEDFFYDEPFARLLARLEERKGETGRGITLVLNGDAFDFLTVTLVPTAEEASQRRFTVDETERRFGLNPTEAKSVYKMDAIMAGHPVFFHALARFVAAGNRVEILRGNHDLELFFPGVQETLRAHVCDFADGPTPEQAAELLRFHQWFYMEPGRVFIEHGNQYEASNSIRYPLHPVHRVRTKRAEPEERIDFPLGSLFVRYFYNRMHRYDPYTPKVISFEQYLEFVRRYNLLDLVAVARDHYPFFITSLRPATAAGRSGPSAVDDAQQRAEFDALEGSTEPRGLHDQLDDLKVHPMSASKLALVREMTKPILKRLGVVAGAGLGAFYVWMLIANMIQATPWLAENVFGKTALLALFSIATVVTLFWGFSRLAWSLRRRRDETVERCASSAEHIARIAKVPAVLMGHTHVADVRSIADGDAVYANSGTWTTVDDPWGQLVPDSRSRTLLLVEDSRVTVCRWNDEAGRIERVPFFQHAIQQSPERCPSAGPPRLHPPGIRRRATPAPTPRVPLSGPRRPGE